MFFLVKAGLPVNGQNDTAKTASKKQATERQQTETPESQLHRSVPQVNKPIAERNEKRKADNSDSYFNALVAPNNLPNVVLAIIGIVGIFVAIGTRDG